MNDRSAINISNEPDSGFYDRFKEVLRALPSLQHASEITGYSYEQIAKWRDRKAKPPFLPMMILTHAAGRSLDWLASGIDPRAEMTQMMTVPVMQQSLVYEDVEMIPRLSVRASAGIGLPNPDHEHEDVERVPISRALLRRLGIRPVNAHIIQASGDSMEATIRDQDDVLIDVGGRDVRSEGVYAVVVSDLAMIKRVQPVVGGYALISDNERYPPITIPREEAEQLRVIGQARLVMRVL